MRLLFAVIALAAILVGGASAQTSDEMAVEAEIAAAARQLDAFTYDLRDDGVDAPAQFESDVRSLIASSRKRLEPVEASLKRSEERLALLGPAPKTGEPAEAAPVASDRAAINAQISYVRGQRTRIIANIDAATALLDEYSAQRLGARYKRLTRRGPPLFSFALWDAAAVQAGELTRTAATHFAEWRTTQSERRDGLVSIGGMIAAVAATLLMLGPVSLWLRRAFSARIEAFAPTPARRVAVAGVKMLTRLIPGIAGGLLVIETAKTLGLLGQSDLPVVEAIWKALIGYLIIDGYARGFLAPMAPAWRLTAAELARARRAFSCLLWIVIVVGVKTVFNAMLPEPAQALRAVANGAAAMMVGALVFAFCRRSVWVGAAQAAQGDTAATPPSVPDQGPWGFIRFAGRLVSFVLLAAPLAGFVALADFLSTRLYYLILLLTLTWFVRAALKELASWGDQRLRATRTNSAADEKQSFQFWIGAGIDLLLLLILTPLLFVLAGVNSGIVSDYIQRAFIGFQIGEFTISLVDILMSIGAFVGILAFTRLFQSAMQRGPFAHSRIDPGIQNSLTTLFGYIGLVLAAVVSLGLLGVDLSNLALIAGALSVGIGFGLQSIVNNFVSGIILLFERPVKAGDWIVTPSGEGIVEKISVRSTVLETFDRASVIIPNSELIASSVTNWTHTSALGRIRVAVGVAYNSDPEQVREVLLRCANAHPQIVRYPEAFVVWSDFGASSLDFEVRAFISDIAKGMQVKTDLRFAIFKAFKEAGIEFPFPAQDVFIRSFPSDPDQLPTPAQQPSRKRAAPPHEQDEIDAPDE
ncbi:MAG: mechanosensitive ion channel domain-containing protein [Pseudomonadota bacterium]